MAREKAKSSKQTIMTQEEKQQWDDLYQYVRKEILLYDQNQSIPAGLVLRLKGLAKGKLVANNAIKDNADYSFEIILYTFKMCRVKILAAISGKNFSSEMSKFIYITRIVENNINDVYQRITNARKSQEKIEIMNAESLYHDGAEYVPNTAKDNKKLQDLW